MVTFDTSNLQRFAVSSLGAVTLSAACLIGAVGPAKAATPVNVAGWQSRVETRIAGAHEGNDVYQPSKLSVADVSVRFTADGDYAGVVLAKSSGNAQVDARALKVASSIAYPALPASVRGAPTAITLKLFFGQGADDQARYDAIRSADATPVSSIELAAR